MYLLDRVIHHWSANRIAFLLPTLCPISLGIFLFIIELTPLANVVSSHDYTYLDNHQLSALGLSFKTEVRKGNNQTLDHNIGPLLVQASIYYPIVLYIKICTYKRQGSDEFWQRQIASAAQLTPNQDSVHPPLFQCCKFPQRSSIWKSAAAAIRMARARGEPLRNPAFRLPFPELNSDKSISTVSSFMTTFGYKPQHQGSSSPSALAQEKVQPGITAASSASSSQLLSSSPSREAANNSTPPATRTERSSSRPTSMIYQPPLMDTVRDTPPELLPIFTFLNSHANKLFQEGYFLKLNDLDISKLSPETINCSWRAYADCARQAAAQITIGTGPSALLS